MIDNNYTMKSTRTFRCAVGPFLSGLLLGLVLTYFGALEYPYCLVGSKNRSSLPENANSVEKTTAYETQSDYVEAKKFYELYGGDRLSKSPQNNLQHLVLVAAPQVICATKVRIGHIVDGGKWVCNPWYLSKNCTIYSLGVAGDVSFDSSLQHAVQNRCSVYGFDPADNKAFYEKNVPEGHYSRWSIRGTSNQAQNYVSLQDAMRRLGHNQIDILKMDIESSEYEVLPSLLNETTPNTPYDKVPACQILLEVHGGDAKRWSRLLELLEKAGYWMFSLEVNTICSCMSTNKVMCVEYSFLHESCRQQYGVRYPPLYYNYGITPIQNLSLH